MSKRLSLQAALLDNGGLMNEATTETWRLEVKKGGGSISKGTEIKLLEVTGGRPVCSSAQN
jgi:hypothetical protein